MIDNFDLIKEHLDFTDPDDFYFVQSFVRGKDGREMNIDGGSVNGNNKNRLVRFWTIKSREELIYAKPDIISICNAVNARAYIHSAKRSFHEVANEFMRISMASYTTENYAGLKGAYSSACGIVAKEKRYLVDIDEKNEELVAQVRNFIDLKCLPAGDCVLYEVPTLHGYHLICKPFDKHTFNLEFPDIYVHKNNPTLLYYNENN